MVIGLVMVGWLVGAAIISTVEGEVLGFSLSDIAVAMFVAGGVIGAYVAYNAMRRLNKEEGA